MKPTRSAGVWTAALAFFALTALAPWCRGVWAAARFPALCLAPGAAVLLWFARDLWRHPARALAATILASALLAPASLFFLMRALGSVDRALIPCCLFWGALLAAAYVLNQPRLRLAATPAPRVSTASPPLVSTLRPPEGATAWGSSSRDLLFIAGASLLVALPLFLNRDLRLRSDAWTHIALVREILGGGYPWTDPRFAGQPLRYFWFFDLWSAGFSARGGLGHAEGLVLANLAGLLAYSAAVVAAARRFFPGRAGRASAIGVVFAGLNPFGLLALPVKLATGLVGETRGPGAWTEMLAPRRFLSFEVTQTLTPYGASFVAWIDKFLVVTAFGLGMAGALFLSMIVWEGARERRFSAQNLLLAAVALGAMFLHHLVAAVFAGFTLAVGLVLARVTRSLPRGRRANDPGGLAWRELARLLCVWAAVGLAAAPYLAGILLGGDPGSGETYGFGLEGLWLWTAFVTVGPLVALLLLGGRRLALALRGGRRAFASFVIVSLLLLLLVRMPTVNENKMIILFFCMTAPFAAAGALRVWRALRRRTIGRIAGAGIAAGAALVPAMIWVGELLHREPPISPGVAAAAAWIRLQAPRDAAVIEPPGRRLLLNLAERDMFVSEFPFVLQCGYPRREMSARIDLVERIYAEGAVDREQSAILERFGRPVYVFCEDIGDDGGPPRPSARQFARVFTSGRTEVYRWAPADSAGRRE
jgi:hypothetical protein